jgi:hypothetical protein
MRPFLLALALLAPLPALAYHVMIPPRPPTWKGSKVSWENAVRRCAEKPTEFARRRCLERLYEERSFSRLRGKPLPGPVSHRFPIPGERV